MKLTADIGILIVDDSIEVFNVYKSIFYKKGLKNLFFAKNTKEANKILETQHDANKQIGIIFCDWQMPEQSGLEFLMEIRSKEHTRKVPFIMATANNELSYVTEAIQAGIDDYIVKPIVPEVLLQKMVKVLKK